MIKKMIAPIQAWLINQGRCGGCGSPLSQGKSKEVRGQITVTCNCGRIFIHDTKKAKNQYRRALFSEI